MNNLVILLNALLAFGGMFAAGYSFLRIVGDKDRTKLVRWSVIFTIGVGLWIWFGLRLG